MATWRHSRPLDRCMTQTTSTETRSILQPRESLSRRCVTRFSDELPVRVLQVVTDNDRRGAQVFACELQRALAEPGWQIETVALAPGRVGGLDIPTLGRSRHSLGTIRALRRKSRHADVVVAHGSTTLPVTALATFGLSCPFVYRQISDSLYWAPTRGHRARVRVGLMRAASVVALWDGAARTLIRTLRCAGGQAPHRAERGQGLGLAVAVRRANVRRRGVGSVFPSTDRW